jgi:hypothetical protein
MLIRLQAHWRICITGVLAMSALTACAALPASPAVSPLSPLATPAPAASPSTAVPEKSMPNPSPETAVPGVTPAPPPDPRDLAVADLAARLSVAPDAITVKVVEPIEWPDASLGCPKPGMMYAQVVTPGYRIVLEIDGRSYEYHADTQRHVVYCESKGAQPLSGGESTESARLAREDLARRLGVSADSITIGAVIGQEFSTDAFNCRTSKERIAKEESLQVVSGQSILLSALGRRYEYHASGQTVIFCRPLP